MGNKRKKEKEPHTKRKTVAGCALFAVGFALLFGAREFPRFAQWYSVTVYPVLVSAIGRVSGLFPFSLSEILLYMLIFAAAVWGAGRILCLLRGKRRRIRMAERLAGLWLFAGILFFLYAANCGVNYQRESFAESAGIEIEKYSRQELYEVCLKLTEEVNQRSGDVSRDDGGVMVFSDDGEGRRELNETAAEAMESMGESCPELSGYYPEPKGLLFPWVLSVQQLTGIYSPFTVEANYNTAIVDYNQPFTACHELSHLRGFMEEDEANFIAFLACTQSEDIRFQYSGYLLGRNYCMNVLYDVDYGLWEQARRMLDPAVEADLAANQEFWSRYSGKIAEVSNKINDTYLKVNDQEDGVKSYSRMMDLIVAYYN